MKIKEIKLRLKEFDEIELPDKDIIIGRAAEEGKSETEEVRLPRLRRRLRFIPAAAACFLVMCAAAFWISRTTVTQARNYREALEFFQKYNLSSEGLNKDEITEVYFDIVKGSFSSKKTEQVIHQTAIAYDIIQSTADADEVEVLWSRILNRRYDIQNYVTTSFEITYIDKMKSSLKKYQNNELSWEKEFDFEIRDYKTWEDYIVVVGANPKWDEVKDEAVRDSFIAVINRDGEVLWEQRFENEVKYETEYVQYPKLITDDKGICVFTSIEKKLVITSFDYNGNVVNRAENAGFMDNGNDMYARIWNVARAQDGYYVQLRTSQVIGLPNYKDCVIKLNDEGEVLDAFNYASDGVRYNIEDMLEVDGKLYLSGYSYASSEEKGLMENMFDILDELGLTVVGAEDEESLNKRTRELLSAVLFVCDTESGEIKELYRISGSVGGSLGVNGEKHLIWDVGNAGKVSYNPRSSYQPVWVLCQIYRYTFDGVGNLIYYDKTDNVTVFGI